MKGMSSALISLLVVFGSFQENTAVKPRMIPAREEIVIQDGDELKIQCRGEGKLQFSTQKYISNVRNSKFYISMDENSGTYTFIRPKAIREDTGWYACAEEGVQILNDETILDHDSNDIAWIYVYVNSSAPFAIDAAFDLVTSVAGGRLVVPCRTTSPNLRVKAEINWGMTGLPASTTYDPKIGFILNGVGRELSAQSFECLVDGQETGTASYTLHIIDPEPLQMPIINQDQIRHVVWGRDLNVDCEITVADSQKFTLYWKVPDSVPKERWSYSHDPKFVRTVANRQSTWKTVLTVRNVEKTDEGEYNCIAEQFSQIQSRTRATIDRIWDPSYTYINASVSGSADIKSHERESALWLIVIDAYPENVTFAWYKPDGQKVVISELDEHGKYSHRSQGVHHYFQISELSVEDNGNYTIKVSTASDEKIISLHLTVRVAPFARMDEVLPFYGPGKSATFTCRASGLPLPNITWMITEYSDMLSKDNPETKYPLNVTNKLGQMGAYQLVSTLNVKVNQSGYVICKSCNEINCADSTGLVLISDVDGNFGIIDPGLVTEGDDIDVKCGASVYNFTSTITWRLPNDQNTGEFDTSRMRLTTRSTNFTSQSILGIRNVRKSDGGKYVCEALNKGGFTERKEYELVVHDALAPRFKDNAVEDSEITIDLKNDKVHSMVKECFADGMPVPQVTWYKNDKLIVECNQYKFSENNRKLMISYFLDGDSGRYKCKATNRVGTAEKYTDIVIIGRVHGSHTLAIGLASAFVIIVIMMILYMGVRLRQEKRLRKELLDAISVNYQEGTVRCWNGGDRVDLVPGETRTEHLEDQSTPGR